MEKNKLFAFIFAFCPGAGEMYMGMMKKGMVIMAAFWGLIAVASFMHMSFLSFLLPVIWFYSFFDTFNVAELPYERRAALDAAFLSGLDTKLASDTLTAFAKRRKTVLGWGGIILGIWMLLEWVVLPVIRSLLEYIGINAWGFNYGSIPNIIVAIVIIVCGVRLLRKKDSAPPAEDFVEFSGRPVTQYAPVVQTEPYAPVAQVEPYAPVVPTEPYAPVVQAEPYAPVVQTEPYAPVAPTEPYAPVAQVEPYAPVVPTAEFSESSPEAL